MLEKYTLIGQGVGLLRREQLQAGFGQGCFGGGKIIHLENIPGGAAVAKKGIDIINLDTLFFQRQQGFVQSARLIPGGYAQNFRSSTVNLAALKAATATSG